jgi:tetratricopeptide (TPR) repeat protein
MKSIIKMVIVALALSLFGCAAIMEAEEEREIYVKGEEYFYNLQFSEAIDQFQKLREDDTSALFMIGVSYYMQKKYDKAILYLEKVVELVENGKPCVIPGSAVFFWLGRAYLAKEDYEKAIKILEVVAEKSVENPKPPFDSPSWQKLYSNLVPKKSNALFWLGNAYYSKGEYQKAVEALNESIKLDPNLSDSFFFLAMSYGKLKEYDKAVEAAKRAIELDPKAPTYYAVLGLIYRDQKKYKEAEENLKKSIELDPKSFVPYLKLADLYYEKESYKEAVNTLTKVLEINPSNMEANYLLINSYMDLGQFDKAIESANKAIKYNTITGVGIKIKKEEGDYPVVEIVSEDGPTKMDGIEIGDKIIKVNNQSTEKLKLEDVINLLRGEEGTQVTLTIKRGDKEFEKIITRKTMIDKKASIFFAQRGLCYREKGNLEQAIKDAEKAYSLNPNLDDTKEALGAVYIDKGKYDEAINILSSANKDNNFSKLLLATAYAKAGKFNEATSVYKNIPEDYLITKSVLRTNAINTLYTALKPYKDSMMQSVKTLEAKGQYREAIKGYANLLKIADEKEAKEIRAHIAELMIKYPHLFALPEEARRSVIRAETYTEEGKFEKAIEEYQKALELSPFYPNLYKALALSYGQIKDYKKAIKNMNIYLELYPDAPDIRTAKDQIYKWEFMMEKGE